VLVFAWLRERNIPPAGPPFWKYNAIDMDRLLEVEVGVPVAAPWTARPAWKSTRPILLSSPT
jgi:hypothetical protein